MLRTSQLLFCLLLGSFSLASIAQDTQQNTPLTQDNIDPSIQSQGSEVLPDESRDQLDLSMFDFSTVPSIEELDEMLPEEIDDLLGLSPSYDIPVAARRSMRRLGLLDQSEGGLPEGSLARQPQALVRAILVGLKGPVLSRWGHILLRRSLVSRMRAPVGMTSVEFAGLRAAALNAMGEYHVARTFLQEIDTTNWDSRVIDAALDAYIATSDLVGLCPLVRLRPRLREDVQWEMLSAICNSFAGEVVLGARQLDSLLQAEATADIDILLAQRLSGAAGVGRRAVKLEWAGVDSLSPWRFALANALGEEIPENLLANIAPYYERISATSPMLAVEKRAQGADRAAAEGIMSSQAIIDLYSQIYSHELPNGGPVDTAALLREAYTGQTIETRLSSLQRIWGDDPKTRYGRYVLTSHASALLSPSPSLLGSADDLLISMLSSGFDNDAESWASIVQPGGKAWALIALSRNDRSVSISQNEISLYLEKDDSLDRRSSAYLLAGLAGLRRISEEDFQKLVLDLNFDLTRESAWSQAISQAAQVSNAALVSLLVGLGMQGDSWAEMTPRHIYFIVRSLADVGLDAEARMIAAEALARA